MLCWLAVLWQSVLGEEKEEGEPQTRHSIAFSFLARLADSQRKPSEPAHLADLREEAEGEHRPAIRVPKRGWAKVMMMMMKSLLMAGLV